VVVVFTQDNSSLELFYTCIGLISIYFVKAPAVVVAVVVAMVVSSDKKAYPTGVKLFYGCFGLGCGNFQFSTKYCIHRNSLVTWSPYGIFILYKILGN
jgi:hypothetical protein